MIVQFEKRCPKCGHDRPVTDFPKNAGSPDGRGFYCRAHHNEANAASKARKKAEYEAAVAELSDSDRARLGR